MKVLIVEDSFPDRELILEMLQEHFKSESKFREAYDLARALEYLGRWDFDCILLDLNLPDSTGWDTFQAIHNAYPRIPVVVLTNNKSQSLALQIIRAGASDVIIKDFMNTTMIFRRILFAVERTKRRPHVTSGIQVRDEEGTDPGIKIRAGGAGGRD